MTALCGFLYDSLRDKRGGSCAWWTQINRLPSCSIWKHSTINFDNYINSRVSLLSVHLLNQRGHSVAIQLPYCSISHCWKLNCVVLWRSSWAFQSSGSIPKLVSTYKAYPFGKFLQWAHWVALVEKNCPQWGDIRDEGLIPGFRRIPLEEGMASPLHYSCLETLMDRGGLAGYRSKEFDMTKELRHECWKVYNGFIHLCYIFPSLCKSWYLVWILSHCFGVKDTWDYSVMADLKGHLS